MRKDPKWQDKARYPIIETIRTSYRDLDILAHVNNIAMAGYYDDARERMTRSLFESIGGRERVRMVTAETRNIYLAEVFHPSIIEIGCGIGAIGNSSFEVAQAAFVGERCVGLCRTVIVRADETGVKPLADDARAALQAKMVRLD